MTEDDLLRASDQRFRHGFAGVCVGGPRHGESVVHFERKLPIVRPAPFMIDGKLVDVVFYEFHWDDDRGGEWIWPY